MVKIPTAEKTLQALLPGQSGVIVSVGNQSGAVKRRLVDMGLTPGTAVTVVRVAPLGDPIEVHLRGYALSLRKDDAAQIVLGGTPPPPKRTQPVIRYDTRRLEPVTLRRMRSKNEPAETRPLRLALVGNPNSGKTTLYNALTGSNQYVGNWPGVTVEKKEGVTALDGREVRVVDLPGIYSLSPYSLEELVARDYILGRDGERPDAVVNIVDATNIERNMYLTVQLLELERPVVVALNFMDESRKRGDTVDVARLSSSLGVPVVPISARTGENLDALLRTALQEAQAGITVEPGSLYDDETKAAQGRIEGLIASRARAAGLPAHWAAVKLLEGDTVVLETLAPDRETSSAIDRAVREYAAGDGIGDAETRLADSRYKFIEHIVQSAVRKGNLRTAETATDHIDAVVTHRYLAIPVFLLTMLLMFAATFGPAGRFLQSGVAFLVSNFSAWLVSLLTGAGAAPWLVSLLTDGIVTGVGGVLDFLPQIALLFFFLSLLEDSGYMARAAFIMDRLLRRFGLSGKAFIPMLMGFGCSVPAVMGARTMENDKDRKMTILLVPFMSCSAKLPVYGLIAAAFFGAWAGLVIFSLYLLGMAMAVVSGLFFRRTLFAGDPAPFVMELPPYRRPTLNNTLIHVWDRVKSFLIRAGTLIFAMSVVLWFLQHFNGRLQLVQDSADSILALIGMAIAPVFKPAGFGIWQAVVALLAGLVAKEAVVASLSLLYGFSLTATGVAVAAALTGFTPLSAFSYLVFILLYIPCVAAVSTIYRETGSLRWTALSAGWQLFVAYILSVLAFQTGHLLGL